MDQLYKQFGDILVFLNNDDVSSATSTKLLETMADVNKRGILQIEVAAVIDLGANFVKGTYALEGDCVLVLKCYEIIEEIRAAVRSAHFPNVEAIAQHLSGGSPTVVTQLNMSV